MFRFSIRDLLWLMVVLGVGISLAPAWWIERARANRWARMYEVNQLIMAGEPINLLRGMALTVVATEGTMQVTERDKAVTLTPVNGRLTMTICDSLLTASGNSVELSGKPEN